MRGVGAQKLGPIADALEANSVASKTFGQCLPYPGLSATNSTCALVSSRKPLTRARFSCARASVADRRRAWKKLTAVEPLSLPIVMRRPSFNSPENFIRLEVEFGRGSKSGAQCRSGEIRTGQTCRSTAAPRRPPHHPMQSRARHRACSRKANSCRRKIMAGSTQFQVARCHR